MTTLRFYVQGEPKPAGSKKFVGHARSGRALLVDDSGKPGKDWRNLVAYAAERKRKEGQAFPSGRVCIRVTFYRARPQSHFLKSGLRPEAPEFPTTKPDTTKLLRAVEDAITGILWGDDSQVVDQRATKRFCDSQHPQPGCEIYIHNGHPDL